MTTETDASPFKLPMAQPPRTPERRSPSTPSYEIPGGEVPVAVSRNAPVFVEREEYTLDRFEYERTGKDPGLVLIFNQENFEEKHLKQRRGSRRDVNEIVLCLQRQGFNINEDNICTDFTRQEILDKLLEVSQSDLTQRNCLIIFFLTHGENFDMLHSHDRTLLTSNLWINFVNCEKLKNKPKMFVFQACKGDGFTTTEKIKNNPYPEPEPSKIVPKNTFNATYLGPDMLIVYSTIEGNVSFRNGLTGSWFIQELCKNITAYGKRDDVVSLIIRTTKCVCGNYFHNEQSVNKKQMPMFVSTLTKKFYLNRNKDRNILLKVLQTNEDMKSMLLDLKEKVDKLLSKDEEKKKKK